MNIGKGEINFTIAGANLLVSSCILAVVLENSQVGVSPPVVPPVVPPVTVIFHDENNASTSVLESNKLLVSVRSSLNSADSLDLIMFDLLDSSNNSLQPVNIISHNGSSVSSITDFNSSGIINVGSSSTGFYSFILEFSSPVTTGFLSVDTSGFLNGNSLTDAYIGYINDSGDSGFKQNLQVQNMSPNEFDLLYL